MKLKQLLFAFVAMLSSFVFTANAQQAKVGNNEYSTIDEAIANWTNGTTLTLLSDVTLSDVITLKSTEHHILNLGTYTMTAASGKDAIVIKACGTGSAERNAITIDADATNPGGINAGSKRIIYYKYADGGISGDDRPIIKINGGVFTGSTSSMLTAGIYTIGSAARKCATLNITGGTFNCSINGSSKSKLIISGGVFNYSVGSQGDSTANRLISGGKFKTLGFMTADSNNTKFWFGTSMGNSNVGLYINDEGYLCVGGPVITELSPKYKAVASNATRWSSYLAYSSAATYGLYYTNAEAAIRKHDEANVTVYKPVSVSEDLKENAVAKEVMENAAVQSFDVQLPQGVENFTVQLTAVEDAAKLTFNVEPKDAQGNKVSNPSEAITFRLPVPAAWSGKAKVYHDGTLLGTYTINEENGAKYIEVASATFSEFAVEVIVPLFNGEGTETSPYIIDSSDKLVALRNSVNGGEAYAGVFFKLTSNIELAGEWTPIGTGSRSSKTYTGNAFKGIFDGDGKTISGLTITSASDKNAATGLFGVVDAGTVKNLNLANVNINVATNNLAGAAIGMMLNGATAENITVSGAVVGNDGVGGIVGRLIVDGTIANCTNNATVTSSYGGIGGIVGKAYYDDSSNTALFANITGCTNTGVITAPMYVGGIVGLARANVSNCVNEGAVNGGTQTGGIIGQLMAAGTVSGNENNATISGKNHLGGIIGDYSQSSDYHYYSVSIANNINRGELSATEQCAAIMGCNNIDGFTGMTATGNISYYQAEGLELFGNPEDMVIDDTNKFAQAPVAKIGSTEYTSIEDAFKAATAGCTIEILSDVTVDYKWDSRNTGGKFTVPVTINGNGNTLKFTNVVNDGYNQLSVFRFEADATVNNLTVDMSEAISEFQGRFRAISSKADLTVNGCTFIGNGSANNTRAIIFGEGSEATIGELVISIADNKFVGWRRGISDNENGQDVKSVTITGNTLEDAAVYVSAKESVTFTGNTVEGAYVNICSYSADNTLNVTATGNTLEANTDTARNYNYIEAGGEVVAEGFRYPVAKIGNENYVTINEAFAKAVEGNEIILLENVSPVLASQEAITKAAVINLNDNTMTLAEDDLYFGTTEFKNGTIVVDPSVKASTAVFWMFANQTLTFDNVDIIATGVTGTYLIGVNGGTNTAVNLLNSSITIKNASTATLTAVICDNGTGNSVTIENSEINVDNIEGRFYLGGTSGNVTVENSTVALNGVKEGFYLRAGQSLDIKGDSKVDITLNSTEGRYGINLTDITATYTKAEEATVNSTLYEVTPVAKIGDAKFTSIKAAIDAAVLMTGDVTIEITSGTYSDDIAITNSAVTAGDASARPNITFKPAAGGKVVLAGTTTLGYRNQGVGASMWNGKVTFEGITFDHATDGNHSLDIQDVKDVALVGCTVIGDGEHGITSPRGNSTYNATFTSSTFKNGAMQVLGQLGANLVVDSCIFNNFNINVQAGAAPGMTIKNSTFNMTLTDANVADSFYAVRTNASPVNIENVEVNVDSELSAVAADQTNWGLFWARQDSDAKWNIADCEVNLTDAAMAQTELLLTKNGATTYDKAKERIVITNLTSKTNNVADLIARTEGCANIDGVKYIDGERDITGMVAKAGDEYYPSLASALDAAQDGDTVTLLTDITMDFDDCTTNKDGHAVLTYITGKDIALNMNGKKIAVEHTSATDRIYAVICVEDGAGLTVTGDGTIDVKTGHTTTMPKVAYMFWKRGSTGHLTIENGTFHMDNSEDSMIYTNGSEIVTVNGGTFTLDAIATRENGFPCIFNGQGNNAKNIIVNGGTYNYDVNHQYWAHEVNVDKTLALKDNGDDTWTVVPAVAYAVEKENNYDRYVGYSTFDEALAVAKAGETMVVLLSDITTSEVITLDKAITFDGNGNTLTYTGTNRAIDVPNNENADVDVTIKNLIVKAATANRGINYNDNGNFNVENVTVEIGADVDGYAINFPGMADNATVSIKNSKLTSRNPLNIWGTDMEINIYDSEIISIDNSDRFNYASIQLNNEIPTEGPNGAIANGTVVNVYGGTLTAYDEQGNLSNVVANATETGVVNISDETTVNGTIMEYVANIGGIYFGSLQAAINAIEVYGYNGPIVVMKSFATTETATVKNGLNVIIDLNGKTITVTDNTTKNFEVIKNQGTLTINDSSADKTGKITVVATVNSGWSRYSAVIANTVGGKLTVNGGTLEHLGGTDMAYAIDNLTNGQGTYAETIINGGTMKSPYRAIRQFLNGVEAQNILTVNGGTIEGANKSIWMQEANANANNGALTITENAAINGDVYLSGNATATEFPVEISVADAALKDGATVLTSNVPAQFAVSNVNGIWGITTAMVAIDGKGYVSLTAAITAAQKGDTITLLTNIDESVTISKNLTIDGAGKDYTGTMTVNTSLTVAVENVNFVKGCIAENSGNHGNLTIKGCTFDGVDNSIGYAIAVRGGDKVTIENSTAKNYSYGMLYVPSAVNNINVKDVTVENVAAAFNISYSNDCMFENVALTNVTYGLHVQNWGARTFTLKNWNVEETEYPVYVQNKGTAKVTFAFEGKNEMGVEQLQDNQYAVYKNAFMAGTAVYGDLNDAIAAATANGTVTLLSDLTVESDSNDAAKGLFNIAADAQVTIDLNGKTIYVTDKSTGNFYVFSNYGDLTIKNGTVNLVAENNRGWGAESAIILNRGGNLTIESGTYTHTGGTDMAFALDNSGNSFGDASATIVDGTLESTYVAVRNRMADTALNGNPGNGTVELNVQGGYINGTKRGIWGQITNASSEFMGSLTVTGGIIEGTTDAAIRIDEDSYENTTVTISDVAVIKGNLAGDTADYSITGGTYYNEVPEDYIVWGYQLMGDTAPYTVEYTGKLESLTIVDNDTNNEAAYTNTEDVIVEKLTYTRKFNYFNQWRSLYVPFEIPVSALSENFVVAYINDIHSEDKDDDGEIDNMWMEPIVIKNPNAVLKANHPYIIYAKSEDDPVLNIELENVKLYSAVEDQKMITCSSVYMKFDIMGTHKAATGSELVNGKFYALNNVGNWRLYGEAVTLGASRLYLTVEVSDDAPFTISEAAMQSIGIRVVGEELPDGTTVIYDVEAERGDNEDMIFDLSGRRVLKIEEGGIYIINGKKVLVK